MKERFYDRTAARLDQEGLGARRERLVAALEGEVLEVGAGTGMNLPRYRRAGRLVALEPDRAYLRRLRARAEAAAVPVEVVRATAEAIPLPDASFDHVVTTIALCAVADLDASLSEIRRVLRPGGTLEFIEHVRGEGSLAGWQDRLAPLHRLLVDGCNPNRETAAAIERAGLRLTTLEHFTMPAPALVRPAVQGSALRQPDIP
jgi:ubiquinone/menaquinone biosynthesis C-methylase UbiE